MKIKHCIIILSLAISFLLNNTSARAQGNLVVNGSFETGDFTGWTVNYFNGVSSSAVGVFSGSAAPDGIYAAFFGFDGGSITQTLSTIPGIDYVLTFSAIQAQGNNGTGFSINGSFTAVNFDSSVPVNNQNIFNPDWQSFNFTFEATSASTTFAFLCHPQQVIIGDDPFSGSEGLDAISVTAVPEPSAMVLSGISLMILCGYVWPRYKHEKSFSKQ